MLLWFDGMQLDLKSLLNIYCPWSWPPPQTSIWKSWKLAAFLTEIGDQPKIKMQHGGFFLSFKSPQHTRKDYRIHVGDFPDLNNKSTLFAGTEATKTPPFCASDAHGVPLGSSGSQHCPFNKNSLSGSPLALQDFNCLPYLLNWQIILAKWLLLADSCYINDKCDRVLNKGFRRYPNSDRLCLLRTHTAPNYDISLLL